MNYICNFFLLLKVKMLQHNCKFIHRTGDVCNRRSKNEFCCKHKGSLMARLQQQEQEVEPPAKSRKKGSGLTQQTEELGPPVRARKPKAEAQEAVESPVKTRKTKKTTEEVEPPVKTRKTKKATEELEPPVKARKPKAEPKKAQVDVRNIKKPQSDSEEDSDDEIFNQIERDMQSLEVSDNEEL